MVSLASGAEQAPLSLDSALRFHCHAGLPCFNRCCRTPTVILSPYDLVRLKQCLKIGSGELLRRCTVQVVEQSSNLPLVFLDVHRTPEPRCPFVGEQGCTVYAHRPAACRLFPVTMGSRLTAGGVEDLYFCSPLEYCRGFDDGQEWTVASWRTHQGFDEYDRGRREWLEILLRATLKGPGEVDAHLQKLFAAAMYDLDRWRALAAPPDFHGLGLKDGPTPPPLQADDWEWLSFSYAFLKFLLFPAQIPFLQGRV